ncbi:response regulator [Rubinisphaera margarita]|uniref:response regulator n=1 Tax=Rubinisphaera margarita TaxID=2909586 RepID=UPI001EE96A8C|nr:response regulator [Rubinisphaera margarita]MCG6158213.1 response regulator [Rubinisphaera margarita]
MSRVLIVDDSALDRQIAGTWVQKAGCIPLYAVDGQEALDKIRQDRPDIVLTDLNMPKIDGLALVKSLNVSHPALPIILMTAYGSEQIAVEALQAGASSYVPKANFRENLQQALQTVISVISAEQQRELVRQFHQTTECRFILGYEPGGSQALISFIGESMTRLGFCDNSTLLRISTALAEALINATDHGNLELDSKLREGGNNDYHQLGQERMRKHPYRDRRVHVTVNLSPSDARFVIRDEGPGFDPSTLPDPTDPENLLRPSGRGVMLMRSFLDHVSYSASGNEVTLVKSRPDLAGHCS